MTTKRTSTMLTLAATLASTASAQIVVGDGQTLTRADLLAGEFNGVPFTLGPDLVIDINDGGMLETLAYSGGYFDFLGTTINVNAGGTVGGGPDSLGTSFLTNLYLNIMPDATVGRMTARVPQGRQVTMYGGSIGGPLHVHGAGWLGSGDFHMLGGSIGDSVAITSGMRFAMTDGSIGDGLHVGSLGAFHMSGGEIGDDFRISNNGFATVTGGAVGDSLWVLSGFLTISGGTFGSEMRAGGVTAYDGESTSALLSLNVSDLMIDGVPIDLTLNEPWRVTQRGGALLEATLADGSHFDLVLNDTVIDGQDYVSQHAVLRVTLVPAPGVAVLLGLSGILAARRRARL